MSSEFDDIRPYNDSELPVVLERISRNKALISGLRSIFLPHVPRILSPFVNVFLKRVVRAQLRGVKSVNDFQRRVIVGNVLEQILQRTTDGLTGSGLEHLRADENYVFVSNHRDIILDSAFISYLLSHADLNIPEIAFGDNLLVNDIVSDLIRINKGIVVRRNLPVREQIKAAYHLSSYIWQTTRAGNSVWIAQREGRAKDGNDETNPTIIKMLYLSQRANGLPFNEFIKSINIVPVSISYELDPCDRMKAWELYRKKKRGFHKKRKNEDLVSMALGLSGHKGRIHIAFAEPLRGDYANEKEVAAEIDRNIIQLYHQWPSNYIAFDAISESPHYRDKYSVKDVVHFSRRFRGLIEPVKALAFTIYANSVKNQARTSS